MNVCSAYPITTSDKIRASIKQTHSRGEIIEVESVVGAKKDETASWDRASNESMACVEQGYGRMRKVTKRIRMNRYGLQGFAKS